MSLASAALSLRRQGSRRRSLCASLANRARTPPHSWTRACEWRAIGRLAAIRQLARPRNRHSRGPVEKSESSTRARIDRCSLGSCWSFSLHSRRGPLWGATRQAPTRQVNARLRRVADASRSSELKMRKEIDMKATNLVLALALLLVGGCKSAGSTHHGEQNALSRCGGGQPGSPGGPIVAGTDNPFITAISRQFIKIKPDVEIKTDVGADGKGHKLTLISRDNYVVLSCRCPAGCSESGDGCFYWIEEGSRNALCLGDCATATSCCFGCGWH